ncbi:cytochrome P450 [Polychaeton citri CBS 116435]|uniref:Cytochrome P450 n=1 Tax=Polychaeton citri CBS 116435 TaxID=1314669 RepID=A0A9P4UT33_9PEZI|nr:cytochrome P450 [Polychaeton citri CBS 116435]
MGLLQTVAGPIADYVARSSLASVIALGFGAFIFLAISINVLYQLVRRSPNEPPLVFHWVPFFGSTITYGMDPYNFFFSCREKYGDVFTFILLGKKTTVCLGTNGNDFILNGKLKDVNAEEIYSPLTTPVFGSDVVYDCPNAKLMEQKKFVKFGLTSSALRSYVQLITGETRAFFSKDASHKRFASTSGSFNIPPTMAELTIYTASRSLQGKEVRAKFDSSFADLYHDLDMGFTPINFMLPWAPLPQNRRRDRAQKKMAETYLSIIRERREQEKSGEVSGEREEDMIWNLMNCAYKDGNPISDKEISHMMIALLMAGQHSSSSTISWILIRLASRPDIQEDLLEEQREVLGQNEDGTIKEMNYGDFARLPLHGQVVKETLRIHAPIHSILRKVKNPMPIEGTPYVIPPTHTLLAAPGVTGRVSEHFPEPLLWEPHRWDMQPQKKYESLVPIVSKEQVTEEQVDYGYGLVSKGASSPYLPFGAGRHRCIGEQFAYVQLQTILATVIRDFKFTNLPGKDGEVVGTDYSSLFSQPLRPAVAKWVRREKS